MTTAPAANVNPGALATPGESTRWGSSSAICTWGW